MENKAIYTIDFEQAEINGAFDKHYHLEKPFFSLYDEFIINSGDLEVDVHVVKVSFGHFVLSFTIKGEVVVPCDRCLDDMVLSIDTDGMFKVRYGMDVRIGGEVYSTTGEDDESDYDYTLEDGITSLDLSWPIYELIELAVPLQNMHSDGECNSNMEDLLQQHLAVLPGEDLGETEDEEEPYEEDTTDPRWDALKKMLNNN